MMRKDEDGIFQACMNGVKSKSMDSDLGPSVADLRVIEEMQKAEQIFEDLLEHAARTDISPGEAGEVLAAILGAWTCVKRARISVGMI